jgi:glyoxylase I family protein
MSIGMKTPGVHHVALRSTDLARSKRFYADLLGFPVILEASNLFLFRAGNTAFGVRGPEAETSRDEKFNPFRVGLDHIALACEDEAELERVAAALTEAGVENTGVKLDETLGKRYIAFKDPDRIAWELYMV